MSNRRKAKRPWLGKSADKVKAFKDELTRGTVVSGQTGFQAGPRIEGTTLSIPDQDARVVEKEVPAVIHFADWEASERMDDEIIGKTVIYTDGTFEMVIDGDISAEAKSIVNFLHGKNPGNFSLAPKEE